MKIQWNKVTWYSKTVALALFVALPFIGFHYGMEYGEALQIAGSGPLVQLPTTTSGSDYYANVSAWQTNRHDDAGFSIAYPLDFPVEDSHALTPSADWRMGSPNISGLKVMTVTVPASFEPQTNFAEARLTVGYSANNVAVSECLKDDQTGGPVTPSSTAVVNGIHFVVFHSDGAGAGNIYQTTSYRTLHGGSCYAVEYTVHSTQIANYPVSYGLKSFDAAKVTGVLDRIVGTFKFL